MTNEELVKLIQEGERDKLPMLWAQVEKFVSMQAGERARSLRDVAGADGEDLYQSGFLALVPAAESFDVSAGMSFVGWLAVHLKTAFSEATGYRTERQRRDPIHRAGSLDAPLKDDTDSTLVDIIPDPTDQYESMEARIYREQLRDKLNVALDMIPKQESAVLRSRFFQNMTLKQIGEQDGISPSMVRQREALGLRKLRHPRITRELEQFIEERTPYFMSVGSTRFNNTNTSSVEEIVLLRERLQLQMTSHI